jgi:putative membrane protein insertion efficiency factor
VNGAFLTFLRNSVKVLLIGAIRGYQLVISPGLPGRCKFYPSCSHYALDAVKEYGAARGFILAAWRVLRCNPLSHGGYDPVSHQKLFAPRGPQSQGVQVRGALPSPPALRRPNGLGG